MFVPGGYNNTIKNLMYRLDERGFPKFYIHTRGNIGVWWKKLEDDLCISYHHQVIRLGLHFLGKIL